MSDELFEPVDSSPSFSDDWFGWTARQFEKVGEMINAGGDAVFDFLKGGQHQIENLVRVAETIDQGARVLGQDPVFGTDSTQATREKLSGAENRAKDVERRLTELREIYRRQQILKGAPPEAYVDEHGNVKVPPKSSADGTQVVPNVRSNVDKRSRVNTDTWRVVR
jgi:hypothetical protein